MSMPSDAVTLPPTTAAPAAGEGPPPPIFPVLRKLSAFVLFPAVCVVGFLLASVPARNSTLWLHLASGREIAARGPFAAPKALTYGVEDPPPSTSWLYDLAAHQLHRLAGDRGFMIAHALLAALLVVVLVGLCRPGGDYWLPGLGALAGALALGGPWLSPGPLLVSALFLGAAMLLLDRIQAGSRPAVWWLVGLFLLWANTDSWFVLGLAVVALRAARAALARPAASAAPGGRPVLAPLLIALTGGAAACLANPLFFRAFRLPALLGLSPAARVLRDDPLGADLILSPLTQSFWVSPTGGSPAGVAFAVLVVGGALSFLINLRRLDPGRLLPWLGVTALVMYQARLMPLFVVVAVPALVLNLREALAGWRPAPESANVLRFLAVLVLLAGPALCVLAWPGWLQPTPYEPRGWALEPDPALVRVAGRVNAWRDEGKLPRDARIFASTLDAGHHLAWLCPGQAVLIDARLDQYPAQTARDFLELREAALGEGTLDADDPTKELRRRYGCDVVLLKDRNRGRFVRAFNRLRLRRDDWSLVALEGNAAMFVTHERGAAPPVPLLDTLRQVLDPPAHRRPGLARLPAPPAWTDPFVRAAPLRSADRDEAQVYLNAYDQLQVYFVGVHRALWDLSLMAGLAGGTGSQGPVAGGTGAAIRLHLMLTGVNAPPKSDEELESQPWADRLADRMRKGYLNRRDLGPTSELFLAIRACRRALADDPHDAEAWYLLGEAYWRLITRSNERSATDLNQLRTLRLSQAAVALNRAVKLRPGYAAAHERLVDLYGQFGYIDLQLEHARAVERLLREAPPVAGTPEQRERVAKERERAREQLAQRIDRLNKEVERQRNIHDANAGNLRISLRAQDAIQRGLARQALEILLKSDTAAFGPSGALLELELMILTGRSDDAREWMAEGGEDLKASLGDQNYYWLHVLISSGDGDHAAAQQYLGDAQALASLPSEGGGKSMPPRGAVSVAVTQALLCFRPPQAAPGQFAIQAATSFEPFSRIPRMINSLRSEASLRTLRGLLALEGGDAAAGRAHLREAEAIAESGIAAPGRDLVRWWMDAFREVDRIAGQKANP